MTLHKVAVCVIIALIAAICATLAVDRAVTVYPTPETKSRFLASYTPSATIDAFKDTDGGGFCSVSAESAAGRRVAKHREEFEPYLIMRSAGIYDGATRRYRGQARGRRRAKARGER